MAKEGVNVKDAIKGLMFRTNQVVEEKDEGGGKRKRAVPSLRPMVEDDILKTREGADGTVVIISKDGMKHRIPPKAA